MISGAGLCWQHVGGVGSTTTTTTTLIYSLLFIVAMKDVTKPARANSMGEMFFTYDIVITAESINKLIEEMKR